MCPIWGSEWFFFLLTLFFFFFFVASASMAYTHPVSPGVNSTLPGRSQLSNNSLVHCLVKLVAIKNNRDNFVLVKQVFNLLSTLMVSGECRNILWKVCIFIIHNSLLKGLFIIPIYSRCVFIQLFWSDYG